MVSKFARMLVVFAVLSLLVACMPATPQVVEKEVVRTVVVEKEVPVEKKVVETVVVEKEVAVEKQVVKPAGESILIFRRPTDALNLDPAIHTDSDSQWRIDQIFEGLVKRDSETLGIKPALAKSWKISEDGLTYTFYLREGVKFHDGTPFDADAVVFNYERGFNKDHPYHKGGAFGQWEQISHGFPGFWKSIKALDKYTVQIELNEPVAPFLANLTRSPFGIGSPTAIKKDVEGFAKNPVGTGPFKFVEWIPGDQIVLEANKEYWGGAPCVDKLVFKVIKDNAAAFLQLKAGTIHGMDNINPEDVKLAEKDPDLVVHKRPLWYVAYIYINLTKKPLDDVRVRQAINLAINRQAIADALYGGMGQPTNQVMPPGLTLGYNPNLPPVEYNPEKAKELLREAGYPDGFEVDFWYMPVTRPYMPAPKEFGEAVAADLAKVGIKAKLQTEDWAAYVADYYAQKLSLTTVGGWPVVADPDDRWLYHLRYLDLAAGYKNDRLTQVLMDASKATDTAMRQKLYFEAAEILYNDVPIIWVVVTGAPVIVRQEVKNFQPDPVGEFFHRVCLVR